MEGDVRRRQAGDVGAVDHDRAGGQVGGVIDHQLGVGVRVADRHLPADALHAAAGADADVVGAAVVDRQGHAVGLVVDVDRVAPRAGVDDERPDHAGVEVDDLAVQGGGDAAPGVDVDGEHVV